MPIRIKTRRILILAISSITTAIVGAMAFVYYFMHTVYEPEVELDAGDIPMVVRSSFAEKFPGASGMVWKFEDDLFETKFAWASHKEAEAYFEPNGDWSRTEYAVPLAELPPKARAYLAAQKHEVEDTERVEMKGDLVTYEVQLNSDLIEWDCVFDAEGNLVSRIRDGSPLEE